MRYNLSIDMARVAPEKRLVPPPAISSFMEPVSRNNTMSYVYLIASDSAVKIGVSNAPEKRLVKLQVASSLPLKIVYTLKCVDTESAYTVERLLHNRFEPHKLKSEWFSIDPEIAIKDIEFALSLVGLIEGAFTHKEEIVRTISYEKPPTFILWLKWIVSTLSAPVTKSQRERSSHQLDRAVNYLRAHPESQKLPSRELAPLIGVSHTLVTKAKRELYKGNYESH